MSNFLQVLIDGILSGLLYALVAAGLSMIWGVMDVINFAHGEFLMVAMYICYWMGFILGIDPLFTWVAAGIFLFIMGGLTYKWIIKRSLGKAAMAPLLATFGLSMLLKNFCMNRFSPNFRLLSGTRGRSFLRLREAHKPCDHSDTRYSPTAPSPHCVYEPSFLRGCLCGHGQ